MHFVILPTILKALDWGEWERCPFQKKGLVLYMQKKFVLGVKLLAHAKCIYLSYRSRIQKELHQCLLVKDLALCLSRWSFSTFPSPALLCPSQSRSAVQLLNISLGINSYFSFLSDTLASAWSRLAVVDWAFDWCPSSKIAFTIATTLQEWIFLGQKQCSNFAKNKPCLVFVEAECSFCYWCNFCRVNPHNYLTVAFYLQSKLILIWSNNNALINPDYN